MANRIEFINLSDPSQRSSSALRRRAYSHAARVNHARVKLARKSLSQASNAETPIPPTKQIEANKATEPMESGSTKDKVEVVPVLSPGLIDSLTSNRRDPFGCFVRPLSQLEQYLFDHCKLIRGMICNLFNDLFTFIVTFVNWYAVLQM
jgi:hypothetical protein